MSEKQLRRLREADPEYSPSIGGAITALAFNPDGRMLAVSGQNREAVVFDAATREELSSECLDHVLVYGRRHLDRVLRAYVTHYTEQRPHRGLDLATPRGGASSPARHMERRRIDRRDVLGGLIHEYEWAA